MAALLGVAGNAGALIGAGRIAALLVTSAGHTALIVVHAARRVGRLRHLPGGTVAACTLRRQLAVVAAVERSAGDILFICKTVFRQERIKAFDLLCPLLSTYHIAARRYHNPSGRRRSATARGRRRCGIRLQRRDTWPQHYRDLSSKGYWSLGYLVFVIWANKRSRAFHFSYLHLISSDMSPLPQSYSPSHTQLLGMHFRLWPQRNCPSLHLGDLAAKGGKQKPQ